MADRTTPSASRGSSPEASLSANDAPSSPQLTPRSKIKAMLADLDDDSDIESGEQSRARLIADMKAGQTLASPCRGEKVGLSERLVPASTTKEIQIEDDEENEEEEEIVRPRGRMAARLQLNRSSPEPDGIEESDNGDGERVKRRLLSHKERTGKKVSASLDESMDSPTNVAAGSDSLDADQIPSSPGSGRTFPEAPRSDDAAEVNAAMDSDSDDLPENPQTNARFMALVEKKRKERLEKEEVARKEQEERAARLQATLQARGRSSSISAGSEDDDENVGRRLTQQARPTRKASKKALEEMSRETQRMHRNMQLAHEARTKKKIRKESLFERFNFRPVGSNSVETARVEVSDGVSQSSSPASEGEVENDTPPTSPVIQDDALPLVKEDTLVDKPSELIDTISGVSNEDEELPDLETVMTQPIRKADKGKGKLMDADTTKTIPDVSHEKSQALKVRQVRVLAPVRNLSVESGSDDDLEIEMDPVVQKRSSVFDRIVPRQKGKASSVHTLRVLAGLTSPGRTMKKDKSSMTPGELHTMLHRRARQQAAQERAQKIEELKAKGIIVQTAEERARDQAEIEDLLEKARREAEELKKQEKELAKRNGEEGADSDPLGDSSEDEEWGEENEEDEENIQLSGSDEERGEEENGENEEDEEDEEDADDGEEQGSDDDDMDHGSARANGMIEDEASEVGEDEDSTEDVTVEKIVPRASRKRVILDEDDEDDEIGLEVQSSVPLLPEAAIPNLRGPTEPLMGLTQIFAGTMAESQEDFDLADKGQTVGDQEQDSLAFLRQLPVATLPEVDFGIQDSQSVAIDSQANTIWNGAGNDQLATQATEIDLHFSQFGVDSQLRTPRAPSATQMSDFPDPTQDIGFQHSSPIADRYDPPPPSTIETMVLSMNEPTQSPTIKRRGRLRRRNEVVESHSDIEMEDENVPLGDDSDFEISVNAFDVMKTASKKPAPTASMFDKKKSNAKEMVDEQAEESEDEYAGLGGASDDESAGEEDEEVRKMINDESGEKVDERALAALYADKERAQDEKQVEKLFRDITNGMLRRKRGTDLDLSDSDDDGEARRRMKRREFAKMRKALLEDENVGKIAENPKRMAFLRAIEDREDDEDFNLMGGPDDSLMVIPDSQGGSDSADQAQEHSENSSLKRKHAAVSNAEEGKRLPPALRRTAEPKRATTAAAIRESLSELFEDPNRIPATDPAESSDIEPDETEGDSFRGKRGSSIKPAVVDRIMLKRAASSGTSANTPLAFHDPSASSIPGFRIPSLLRRATSQLSSISESSSTSMAERASRTEGIIRQGGGKKSSVNFYARESEKRRVVEKVDAKRLKGRLKVAGERRGVLGGLGTGSFD